MRNDDTTLDKLIRRSDAFRAMGLSRTTAWRRERSDPTFPPRIQIGPNSYRYRVSDVQRWMQSLPIARPWSSQ